MQSSMFTFTKQMLLLSLVTALSFSLKTSVAQNCELPMESTFEANQLIVSQPFNGYSTDPNYLSVVGDSLTNVTAGVFQQKDWFGGYKNGELFARVLGGINSHDYVPGPATVDNMNGGCADWTRSFAVRDYDILAHKSDFNDNGVIDNPNQAVFGWPGHGNPHFEAYTGISLPTTGASAPFVDVDLDGIYNPAQGDYPHPDDLSLNTVFREMRWAVSSFEMLNLGTNSELIERRSTLWALSCDDLTSVEANTVFMSHTFVNRSQFTYDSLIMGLMHDADLGHYADDAFGFSQGLNSLFVYNYDNIDGTVSGGSSNPSYVFGENPPVLTMTMLDKPMYKGIGFMNPSIGNPFPGQTDPGIMIEFWNYLNGKWRDGLPLTLGGIGYDPNGQPTDFIFDGNPANPNAWAMVNETLPFQDWRTVTSIQLGNLEPGGQEKISYCYSFHNNKNLDHLEQVVDAINRVEEIQDKYDNQFEDACTPTEICLSDDCVWPGDTDHDGVVRFWDYLYPHFSKNINGPARGKSTNWFPYNSDDWSDTGLNQVNLKHVDASGDGIIDAQDFKITEKNMDKQTPDYQPIGSVFLNGDDVALTFGNNVDPTNVEAGAIIIVEMDLNTLDTYEGLAFAVEFDTAFFRLSGVFTQDAFAQRDLPEREDLVFFGGDDVALSDPFLGRLIFVAKMPLNVFSEETCLRIVDTKAFGTDESEHIVTGNELCATFGDVVLDDISPSENVISIYPNPVISRLNIENIGASIVQIEVFSVDGKRVHFANNQDTSLDVSDLVAGIYFLKIKTERGVVLKKFVKQ